jgi:polyphosphate kinase
MVRVAGLQRAVEDGDESPDLTGMTPSQQLAAIAHSTRWSHRSIA